MPGTTELVESFLAELIADSSDSAFERASLPRGIEERLAKVDWTVKDVMVGTVRTKEQLQFNLEKKWYYVPASYINDDVLPIRYIALHEQGVGTISGIKVYGEVLETRRMKRSSIPTPTNRNPDELYYCFRVRSWETLENPITIKDTFKGKPRFTNKLLLDTCTESYQLFEIGSEADYRLMKEIINAFDDVEADEKVYKINNVFSITTTGNDFTVMSTDGQIEKVSKNSFKNHPRQTFSKIKKMVE